MWNVTQGFALSERNLVLTGYAEPNKPMITQQVAQTLDMPYVDVEQRIEEYVGETMEQIRATFGERRLKAIEETVMQEVILHRHTVIRISASILNTDEHFTTLERTGPIINLFAQLGSILQKVHLGLGSRYHNPDERAVIIGDIKREWKIRQRPGLFEIDATYLSDEELTDQIVARWQLLAIERA